jgi:hypothetical protein
LIWDVIVGYKWVMSMIVVGLVLHWLPQATKDKFKNIFIESNDTVKIGLSLIIVFVIIQFISSGLQPFIYFQF